MKLKDYLHKNKITYAQFAADGGWHHQAVYFWATGRRIPRLVHAIKIEEITKGAVKASEIRTPQ